jgi:hypothetical protein
MKEAIIFISNKHTEDFRTGLIQYENESDLSTEAFLEGIKKDLAEGEEFRIIKLDQKATDS